MIALFTDFGAADLYVGQVKAAVHAHAPAAIVVDLLHDVPNFAIRAGAHLLAALALQFPAATVFFAVVDPGVGTDRNAVVVEADSRWYVGPDNGLLSVAAARAAAVRAWRIAWKPSRLSASFHGRDLFAPIAAWLDRGELARDKLVPIDALGVRLDGGDLAEVLYVDHYGNAMTGLRACNVARDATIATHGARLSYSRTFGDAPAGSAFWYENSLGLLEIAANGASAAGLLHIHVGDAVFAAPSA